MSLATLCRVAMATLTGTAGGARSPFAAWPEHAPSNASAATQSKAGTDAARTMHPIIADAVPQPLNNS
jgi:hypothetical protein